jgi:hypothetical protein
MACGALDSSLRKVCVSPLNGAVQALNVTVLAETLTKAVLRGGIAGGRRREEPGAIE